MLNRFIEETEQPVSFLKGEGNNSEEMSEFVIKQCRVKKVSAQ